MTKEQPTGNEVLNNFNRFKTMKQIELDEQVKKGDYKVPLFSQNSMCKSNGPFLYLINICLTPFAIIQNFLNLLIFCLFEYDLSANP